MNLNLLIYSIKIISIYLISLFIFTSPAYSAAETPIEYELQELLNDRGTHGFDNYGFAVAIDGDMAVVGAPIDRQKAGVAYIFHRDSDGIWRQSARLEGSNIYRKKNSYFGYSVDIAGDTVVVGAPGFGLQNFYTPSPFGEVYVYTRDEQNRWYEQTILTDIDAEISADFGASVEIEGDTLLVGQPDDDWKGFVFNNVGAVHVYERDENNAWIKHDKWEENAYAEDNLFGHDTALDGNLAVVCAPGGIFGTAFVYARNDIGDWSEEAKLNASDMQEGDAFCNSVAISGDTILIGASDKEIDGTLRAGAAYLYSRSSAGEWSQTRKITLTEVEINDFFGASVALDGNHALISKKGFVTVAGSSAVFRYTKNVNGHWLQTSKWLTLDPSISGIGSYGNGIDISGETAIVGASNDTALIYAFPTSE